MRYGLLDQVSLQQMLFDTLDHSDDIVFVLEQTGDDIEDIVVASANETRATALVILPRRPS